MEKRSLKAKEMVLQGNEACAKGALYAGCRFFAGYPITPSTEIIEMMSGEMYRAGGAFIQMEDEIGSACAIIGARWGGKNNFDSFDSRFIGCHGWFFRCPRNGCESTFTGSSR